MLHIELDRNPAVPAALNPLVRTDPLMEQVLR